MFLEIDVFNFAENIVKTIIYLIIVLLAYMIERDREQKEKSLKYNNSGIILFSGIMAFLFSLYTLLCESKYNISDKTRYALRFENDKMETWTVGLQFIGKTLRTISTNRKILFVTVTIISISILIFSLSSIQQKHCIAMYMILMSHVALFPLYAFKQAISMAFVNLAFKAYLEKNKLKCIVYLFIGILFHEAACIMIPVFAVLLFSKAEKTKIISAIMIIFIIFSFPVTSIVIVRFLHSYIPSLYLELQKNGYINTIGGIGSSLSVATIVKGIPIYLIAFSSMVFHKRFSNKIERYNDYMFLSIMAASIYFSSLFMYWMARFSFYFYFIIFIFWSLLSEEIKIENKKEYINWNTAIVGTLSFFTLRFLYITYRNFGGF